jgi:hypothetical protein
MDKPLIQRSKKSHRKSLIQRSKKYYYDELISKNNHIPINRYPLIYEPDKWNSNLHIKTTHNCYAYAHNDYNPNRSGFPLPGVKAGMKPATTKEITCPNITKRVLEDNKDKIIQINPKDTCPSGYNKLALVVDDEKDFHFYRYDTDNKIWSHKPGSTKVTLLDDSNNLIYHPIYADRNYEENLVNYDGYCMTYCAKPDATVL